jgi:hypothetical protein
MNETNFDSESEDQRGDVSRGYDINTCTTIIIVSANKQKSLDGF